MARLLVLGVLASLALAGCTSSSEDVATSTPQPGAGVVTNPSGKPKNAEEEAYAQKMSQSGQARSEAMGRDAKAMAEAMAKAKAGG